MCIIEVRISANGSFKQIHDPTNSEMIVTATVQICRVQKVITLYLEAVL
jgi:hypothetical protein